MKKIIIGSLVVIALAIALIINFGQGVVATDDPIVEEEIIVVEEEVIVEEEIVEELSPVEIFAKCIDNSGAHLYGAIWCGHCKSQKELFGAAARFLPYVECSTADNLGQLQVCKDAGITSYPTWIFADGSRQSGNLSLAILAEKTNCELPLL